MNLRTITWWVLYNPERRRVVREAQFKAHLRTAAKAFPECVLVKVKGHYVLPRSSTTTREG